MRMNTFNNNKKHKLWVPEYQSTAKRKRVFNKLLANSFKSNGPESQKIKIKYKPPLNPFSKLMIYDRAHTTQVHYDDINSFENDGTIRYNECIKLILSMRLSYSLSLSLSLFLFNRFIHFITIIIYFVLKIHM